MEPLKSEINAFKNNWKLEEFQIIEQISQGSFGDVFKATHPATKDKLYAIKNICLRAKESDEDIENEINILESLNILDLKTKSLPNFIGYHKQINKYKLFEYDLVFEYYPNTLENLISKYKTSNNVNPFPFQRISQYFKSLVNSLAFLQRHKF